MRGRRAFSAFLIGGLSLLGISPALASVDLIQTGFDRYMYVGAAGALFLMQDPKRYAVPGVMAMEPYWGGEWSRQLGFEGSIYNYAFRENLTKRPEPFQFKAPQVFTYRHVGIRLRGLVYLGEKRTLRLRGTFSDFTTFIPYISGGLSLEPSVVVKDYHRLNVFGSRFFGVSFTEGGGFLEVFRTSNFRIRYELALLESYQGGNGTGLFSASGAFIDAQARVAFEYAFAPKVEAQKTSVTVLDGAQLHDVQNLEKLEQSNRAPMSFDAQLLNATNGVNLTHHETLTVLFPEDSASLDDPNYTQLHAFERSVAPNGVEEYVVMIKSYAPDTGDPEGDLSLARERALSLQRFFIQEGLPINRIRYSWFVLPKESAKDKALLSPQGAPTTDRFRDRAEVQMIVYTEQSAQLLKTPPVVKTQSATALLLQKAERDPRLTQMDQQKALEQKNILKKRTLLLENEGLRQPDKHESDLVLSTPSAILKGNGLSQSLALDTRVHEEFDYQGSAPATPENAQNYLIGDKNLLERPAKEPHDPVSDVKSHKEYYELQDNALKAEVSKTDTPTTQPKEVSIFSQWVMNVEDPRDYQISDANYRLLEAIADMMNADLPRDVHLMVYTIHPSAASRRANHTTAVSRQLEIITSLAHLGLPVYRVNDNTIELDASPSLFSPVAPEDAPSVKVIKRLLLREKLSINDLQSGTHVLLIPVYPQNVEPDLFLNTGRSVVLP